MFFSQNIYEYVQIYLVSIILKATKKSYIFYFDPVIESNSIQKVPKKHWMLLYFRIFSFKLINLCIISIQKPVAFIVI